MLLQPLPTTELDRSGDQVYIGVMAMVKQVVQLKNNVSTLPASEYPNSVKVGPSPGGGHCALLCACATVCFGKLLIA